MGRPTKREAMRQMQEVFADAPSWHPVKLHPEKELAQLEKIFGPWATGVAVETVMECSLVDFGKRLTLLGYVMAQAQAAEDGRIQAADGWRREACGSLILHGLMIRLEDTDAFELTTAGRAWEPG